MAGFFQLLGAFPNNQSIFFLIIEVLLHSQDFFLPDVWSTKGVF